MGVHPFVAPVNAALERYLDFGSGCPEHLDAAMRYSLLAPGKRFRPALVLSASLACGSEIGPAMPAACAVEMVHTYSLIHDDLPAMDDDDLRRGRPSCHMAHGEANAILAGDALLTAAFEVLARDVRPGDLAIECIVELAQAAGPAGMVGGQADDLRRAEQVSSLVDLESIHARKTGALILASVRLGARIARANEDDLERLTQYGMNLGIAFQLVDDLLDATGDVAILGKRAQKDHRRNSDTVPALLGLEPTWDLARNRVEQALRALGSFDHRAGPLRELAALVLQRNK